MQRAVTVGAGTTAVLNGAKYYKTGHLLSLKIQPKYLLLLLPAMPLELVYIVGGARAASAGVVAKGAVGVAKSIGLFIAQAAGKGIIRAGINETIGQSINLGMQGKVY